MKNARPKHRHPIALLAAGAALLAGCGHPRVVGWDNGAAGRWEVDGPPSPCGPWRIDVDAACGGRLVPRRVTRPPLPLKAAGQMV
jgi:hypothetical protein